MPQTAAEIARTLATGRLAGSLLLSGQRAAMAVTHAIDDDGDVLVLARRGDDVTERLRAADDQGAVLSIADQPPFPEAPSLGTVWLAGWISEVSTAEAQQAAIRFAQSNPVGDLLDVGQGAHLFRLSAAEIELHDTDGVTPVGEEDFAAATPDPFHGGEQELLADMRDHHLVDLAHAAGLPGQIVWPVRLDRHGLTVKVDQGYARIEFPYAASGPCCVARILGFGKQCMR